jgi:hypothetical protein
MAYPLLFLGNVVMHPHDLYLPFTANQLVVLAIFVGSLFAFDVVLVRWLKLSKIAWKHVDYIWLGFAALGLFGSVSQVRMASATGQLDMYEARAMHSFESVRNSVTLYASSPGAICRTFVRTEYSPPPDELQRIQSEFDTTCAWVKQMNKSLSKHDMSPPKPVDRTTLPSRPNVTVNMLKEIYLSLDNQFGYFDQSMEDFETIHEASKKSSMETLLVFLSPFLLAIALALRITKVTGEIKHERN